MWKVLALPLCLYFLYVLYLNNTAAKADAKTRSVPYDAYANDAVQNYLKEHAEIAIQEMEQSRIPASITLAQAILESNCGKSTLALKANNHFGIKSSAAWDNSSRFCLYSNEWQAQQKHMIRVLSCFQKFNSTKESYQAHSKFLRARPHYASLFDIPANDYKKWSIGLQKAGYATDPNYAQKLQQIIARHQLYDYDKLAN